jgi:hypothetical protein
MSQMLRNVYPARLTRRIATLVDVQLMDKVKPALSSSVYQMQVPVLLILSHSNSHSCAYSGLVAPSLAYTRHPALPIHSSTYSSVEPL